MKKRKQNRAAIKRAVMAAASLGREDTATPEAAAAIMVGTWGIANGEPPGLPWSAECQRRAEVILDTYDRGEIETMMDIMVTATIGKRPPDAATVQ